MKYLILLTLLFLFNYPAFASWQINEQECQCKIIPADEWHIDFVDLKTDELIGRVNTKQNLGFWESFNQARQARRGQTQVQLNPETGMYKVRDKWYQAKWILTEVEKAQIDLAAINAADNAARLQTLNTFLLLQHATAPTRPVYHSGTIINPLNPYQQYQYSGYYK